MCFICDNMCVWAKNLLVQFWACMRIPHTSPTHPSVWPGGIHAFSVCVSTCAFVFESERQTKHFYNTYSCPYKPTLWCLPPSGASILLRSSCENFYFSLSCLHFQMEHNFPCPYCFIMTYFDYLSQGDAQRPKRYRSVEIKRGRDMNKETQSEGCFSSQYSHMYPNGMYFLIASNSENVANVFWMQREMISYEGHDWVILDLNETLCVCRSKTHIKLFPCFNQKTFPHKVLKTSAL